MWAVGTQGGQCVRWGRVMSEPGRMRRRRILERGIVAFWPVGGVVEIGVVLGRGRRLWLHGIGSCALVAGHLELELEHLWLLLEGTGLLAGPGGGGLATGFVHGKGIEAEDAHHLAHGLAGLGGTEGDFCRGGEGAAGLGSGGGGRELHDEAVGSDRVLGLDFDGGDAGRGGNGGGACRRGCGHTACRPFGV